MAVRIRNGDEQDVDVLVDVEAVAHQDVMYHEIEPVLGHALCQDGEDVVRFDLEGFLPALVVPSEVAVGVGSAGPLPVGSLR